MHLTKMPYKKRHARKASTNNLVAMTMTTVVVDHAIDNDNDDS